MAAANTPGSGSTTIVQASSGLLKLFCWIGWVGFCIAAGLVVGQYQTMEEYYDTSEGLRERFHSGKEYGEEKIAIIQVRGVIVDGAAVRHQIERVRNDKSVKAVVLRVDSPGGTIAGSDYIYHHLTRLRDERKLPIVVSMGSIAASGGYYVAMAVGDQDRSIFAEPTTTTGSIGVIIPHYDISELMKQFNVRDDSIVSHPRKQMLSMTRPIDDDQRALLQAYVDEAFGRFKEIVRSGRPAFRDDDASLDMLATGEIFTAKTALKEGLVDELGFLEEAIARAGELAGLKAGAARVIKYSKPAPLIDLGLPTIQAKSQLDALLELSTPRAYFLCSTFPALISNRPAAVPGD